MADRRRWAVGAGLAVAALLLLSAVAAALTYTPMFVTDRVRVEGATHRSDRQILEAGGLDTDVNVFHLDAGAAERALETDPWIVSATVTTELPDTVVVRVVERRPAVIAGEEVLAGDATPLPGARTGGLPIVRDAVGDLDEGDHVAAALAAAALDPGLRGRVRYVVVAIDGDLELLMDDGLTVRWGSGGDDDAKASSLAAFLTYAEEQGRHPIRVDVSVPAAPSARFAS